MQTKDMHDNKLVLHCDIFAIKLVFKLTSIRLLKYKTKDIIYHPWTNFIKWCQVYKYVGILDELVYSSLVGST